mgnify:CR=1 FL=1
MHSVTVMKAVAAAGKQVWEDQPRTIEDVCSIVEGAGFTIKDEHHPYVQVGDDADGVNIGDGDCLGPVWMQTNDGPADVWFHLEWTEDDSDVYLVLNRVHIDAIQNDDFDDHKRTGGCGSSPILGLLLEFEGRGGIPMNGGGFDLPVISFNA